MELLLLPLLSVLLPIYCDPVELKYPDCDQNVCIINKPEFILTGLSKLDSRMNLNLTLTLSSPHPEPLIPVRMKCVPDGNDTAITSCEEFVAKRFYDVHLTRINLSQLTIIGNHTVELHTAINSELDSVLSDPLPLTLIVVDSRKLRIGFSEDSLELQGDSLSINIRNFDAPYRLEMDVILTVRLRSSQNPNISTANVNFNFLDVNQNVSFADLDPLQNYKAILSLADTEMKKQVTLNRKFLQISMSMADVIPKINFVASNWKTLYDKLSDLYGKISNLYNKTMAIYSAIENKENIDGCKDSFQCANTTTTTTATATTTTATTTAATTTATTTAATITAATTTATTTAATEATDAGTGKENTSTGTQTTPTETGSTSTTGTERTTETDHKTSTGNVDDTEPSIIDGGNGFFWWIFAGFVVVLAVAVLGYLVFNHREKVKVYAVGWWKGSNAAKSTSSKSRKYTALPTSIHDTLTHED